MRRTLQSSFIAAALLIVFTTPSHALFGSAVDKANEFMAAGMYPQAATVLEQRISEKPTDAEAHFVLGTVYINQGKIGQADERFGSAVRLRTDYGFKVGDEYLKAGSANMGKDPRLAKQLYSKAIEYKPALKKTVTDSAMRAGSDDMYDFAYGLDRSLGKEISDHYLSRGDLASLQKAGQYSSHNNQNIGTSILNFAKNQPKEEKKKLVELAKKYVDQSVIDDVIPPPEWKTVFGPKEYIGIGLGEDDWLIDAPKTITDIQIEDKIVITGEEFQYLHNGWQTYHGRMEKINKSSGTGKSIGVKAKKNGKIIIEIQRLMEQ